METETQFNDILGTLWNAGVIVDGMEFVVTKDHHQKFRTVVPSAQPQLDGSLTYESDFGTVTIRIG